MRLSLLRANAVIIATAVLHNICRLSRLEDIPPEVEIPNADEVPVLNNAEEADFIQRATLISDFFDK